MITLITRESINHFSRAAPMLDRTLRETSLGESWTLQALFDHIVNIQAYAFIQEESQYAGAFVVSSSPLKRSLYYFWGGKEESNKVPIDHPEVDQFLVDCAKALNCTEIIAEGRKGWEKIGAPLGYREDTRQYIKEVPHELSEIQPAVADGSQPTGS